MEGNAPLLRIGEVATVHLSRIHRIDESDSLPPANQYQTTLLTEITDLQRSVTQCSVRAWVALDRGE